MLSYSLFALLEDITAQSCRTYGVLETWDQRRTLTVIRCARRLCCMSQLAAVVRYGGSQIVCLLCYLCKAIFTGT
jgi:hypothetical protein